MSKNRKVTSKAVQQLKPLDAKGKPAKSMDDLRHQVGELCHRAYELCGTEDQDITALITSTLARQIVQREDYHPDLLARNLEAVIEDHTAKLSSAIRAWMAAKESTPLELIEYAHCD